MSLKTILPAALVVSIRSLKLTRSAPARSSRSASSMHWRVLRANRLKLSTTSGARRRQASSIAASKPGLFAAQRATRQGVGETRFGELIRYHLAQTRR